jgi:hypothetical protein
VPAPTPPVDDDRVLLRVPADPRYARVVRVAVSAYALRLGLAPGAVEDLRLAVDEALILLMGSGGGPGTASGDDAGCGGDGPTIMVTLDADADRPPVIVELRVDPAPVASEPDEAARSRFEEIVPGSIVVDVVDQRRGRITLRHPG